MSFDNRNSTFLTILLCLIASCAQHRNNTNEWMAQNRNGGQRFTSTGCHRYRLSAAPNYHMQAIFLRRPNTNECEQEQGHFSHPLFCYWCASWAFVAAFGCLRRTHTYTYYINSMSNDMNRLFFQRQLFAHLPLTWTEQMLMVRIYWPSCATRTHFC